MVYYVTFSWRKELCPKCQWIRCCKAYVPKHCNQNIQHCKRFLKTLQRIKWVVSRFSVILFDSLPLSPSNPPSSLFLRPSLPLSPTLPLSLPSIDLGISPKSFLILFSCKSLSLQDFQSSKGFPLFLLLWDVSDLLSNRSIDALVWRCHSKFFVFFQHLNKIGAKFICLTALILKAH